MKVQAAVFYEVNSPFKIETLDLEPPRAGEVLVKVAGAGVCHSDWHLVTGATKHPAPVVPGHEGAGWWKPWAQACRVSSPATTWP